MKPPSFVAFFLPLLALVCAAASAAPPEFQLTDVPWQQVDASNTFTVCMDREESSLLDRVSRMVFAVQTGKAGASLDTLSVHWQIRQGSTLLAERTAPIPSGMLEASFRVAGLKPGRYDVAAELRQGATVTDRAAAFFRIVPAAPPPQRGRIALNLPRGVPLKSGTAPIACGVPFPKGALWSKTNVRLVKADGTPVPAQFGVRSRWGHSDDSSIRWLAVDFQAEPAPAWWPERRDTRYFLEFGPRVKPVRSPHPVTVTEAPEGLRVDNGPLQFLVRRQGFNLLDQVRLEGRNVLQSTPQAGLYLVDHEGSTYRAANDKHMTLTVEERGDLRTVIRAEGWYVKDGSAGELLDWKLPTDKLCKQVTRIEAYAGKPYVRVLSTWILTFDSLSVRLKDVGLTLPLTGGGEAEFGVEAAEPIHTAVPATGVRLLQHLPHAFAIEDGAGHLAATGTHSAGWVMADTASGLVAIGHRETWQRFPKELEARPGALTLHVWPAHGRTHPEIDELAPDQIHRLWFAHRGTELNLAMPWAYYWAACDLRDEFRAGVYSGAGTTMAGVHASALGSALTSDVLIHFAAKDRAAEVRDVAEGFQAAPHALPDPKWLCDSLAIGYVQPYEPDRMKVAEEVIDNLGKAPWETQNAMDDYGMWIYRAWHDKALKAPRTWDIYRLYNATHHYDAYVPWMLYARSGDPTYLSIGRANMRILTDLQMIHYDNPAYPHRETWSNGRIVGSTRHTNGFVPWGGDHGLLGHLTCYNGIMLAYYLTGDLRFREVVVDEWQKTLLTDRANPQFPLADRSAGVGRDASCSLGELLDLYQLTHHPGILGYWPKLLQIHLGHMTTWGLPNLNLVLLYGSEQARRQIVEAIPDYRKTHGQPADPHGVWTGFGFGIPALAWILDPATRAHVDAWAMADIGNLRARARQLRAQEPGAMAFCGIPDHLIYLPWTLYAVARGGGDLSPGALKTPQPTIARKTVVREPADREFEVAIRGTVGEGGLAVTIQGPDGVVAVSNVVPAGDHNPWVIRVPRDGRTGDYVIAIPYREPMDRLLAPLTQLPEIYLPNDENGKPGWWWQHGPTTYFTRSRGDTPEILEIGSHGMSPGAIISHDGMESLDATPGGRQLKARIGPEGAWVVLKSVYAAASNTPVLSVSPDKWFLPKFPQP